MAAMRLNKALASAGVCSRRKADELIQAGCVAVNGVLVRELGLSIDPERDQLAVNGVAVPLPSGGREKEYTYILLHKPIHVVCTARDPQGRATVLDLLPRRFREKRLYPVGRLDYFSEGLVLLTDDGELTNRLTHPSHHQAKLYEVVLREIPAPAMLERMRSGMRLREGERLAPVAAEYDRDSRILRMTLHQGVNRQIRRMCRDLGLTILTLRRIQLGPLTLGDLPKGGCRPLLASEVAALKETLI